MDLSKIVFNQKFTLAVPESELSDEGIAALLDYVKYAAPVTPEMFREKLPKDWSWLAKVEHGTYAGTISKRIQSYLFKTFTVKLSEGDVASLGNLAAQHVLEAREFTFDFDEHLKWQAGEYGDKGSCFWTQKPHVLPLLKYFGGFAIRLYDQNKGIGRALIMPMVASTGDGWDPDHWREPLGLLVFNGYGAFGKNYGRSSVSDQTYGQMQVYDYARLLALFLGVSYERVRLGVNDSYEYPLYVNNQGTAVLVAPTEVVAKYKARGKPGHKEYHLIHPYWSDEHIQEIIVMCGRCRTHITLEGPEPSGKRARDGNKYCFGCYNRLYGVCLVDGAEFSRGALHPIHAPALNPHDQSYLCRTHWLSHSFECPICHDRYHLSERLFYHVPQADGTVVRLPLCRNCYSGRLFVSPCPVCTRDYAADVLRRTVDGHPELGPCPECQAAPKGVGERSYLSPQPLPQLEPEPVTDPWAVKLRQVDQQIRANWNAIAVPMVNPVEDGWDRLARRIPLDTHLTLQRAAEALNNIADDQPAQWSIPELQVGALSVTDTLEVFNHYLHDIEFPGRAVDYEVAQRAHPFYRIVYQLDYD